MYAMNWKNRFHHVHTGQLHPITGFMDYCGHNPAFVSALMIIGVMALMAGLIIMGLIFGQGGAEMPYRSYPYPYIYP